MASVLVLLKPEKVARAVTAFNSTGMDLKTSTAVFENFLLCPERLGGVRGKNVEFLPFKGIVLVAQECWERFNPLLGKIIKRAYVEQIADFDRFNFFELSEYYGQPKTSKIIHNMKGNVSVFVNDRGLKPAACPDDFRREPRVLVFAPPLPEGSGSREPAVVVEPGPASGRDFTYAIKKTGDFFELHEMTQYPLIANVFVAKDKQGQKGNLVFSFTYSMTQILREPYELLDKQCNRERLKQAVDRTGARLFYEMWDCHTYNRPHAVVAYLPIKEIRAAL